MSWKAVDMWARVAFPPAVAVQGRRSVAELLRAERLAAVAGVVGPLASVGRWSAEVAPVGWQPFPRAAAGLVVAATRPAAGPVVAALGAAARAAHSPADLFRAKHA